MLEFTKEQLDTARAYLKQVRDRAKIDHDEWWEAYRSWAKSATWFRYDLGGTDIHTALWWYQYRHKPRSKEWRPAIILRALVRASERDYVEPEPMLVSAVALMASERDKKQARFAFIRKRGFETYRMKILPILKRGGVEALFLTPATPELREYMEILTNIAKGECNGRRF